MNSIASVSTRKATRMIQRGVLQIFPLYEGGPLTHRVVSKHNAVRAASAFARHGRVRTPIDAKAHGLIVDITIARNMAVIGPKLRHDAGRFGPDYASFGIRL